MPDIEFLCPGCRQTLEAPVEIAGEQVECPNCQQVIEVPAPEGETPASSFAGADMRAARRDDVNITDILRAMRDEGQDADTDEADGNAPDDENVQEEEEDEGESAEPDGTACPGCGAEMEPDAVLCTACGFHRGLGRRLETQLG